MKYNVTVSRTSYSEMTFEVEADNELEAHKKGILQASNTVMGEYNADYEVEFIEKAEEEKEY